MDPSSYAELEVKRTQIARLKQIDELAGYEFQTVRVVTDWVLITDLGLEINAEYLNNWLSEEYAGGNEPPELSKRLVQVLEQDRAKHD